MNCQTCNKETDTQCPCQVRYCDSVCQRMDFNEHQKICPFVEKKIEVSEPQTAVSNGKASQDVTRIYKDKRTTIIVVCDGHGSDDVRAIYPNTAADTFIKIASSRRKDYKNWAKEIDEACATAVVQNMYGIIEDTNGVLLQSHKKMSVFHGGTTLSAIVIDHRRQMATWFNAGDSEICFIRNSGEIETLSTDHSPNSVDSWKQLNEKRLVGENVGDLYWNVTDRKAGGLPLPIFDKNGKMIDYAFSSHEPVKQSTEEYHDANDAYRISPTPENRQKLNECLVKYNKSFKQICVSSGKVHSAYEHHPKMADHKRLIMSTASGDYGCYLIGPNNCMSGLETEVAMVRMIGDRQAMLHGASASFSIGERPLSEFKDGCLFVASDGVWDCFTKSALAKIVAGQKELLTCFVNQGLKLFGRGRDDISYALVRL